MPLWGNEDEANSSVISAVQQVNKSVSVENRNALFGNTTPNVYIQGVAVGQFGVSADEQKVLVATGKAKGAHAGWNLRTVGSGGRAGRVFYETLVAMGSIKDDAADDAILPDSAVRITIQPSVNNKPSGSAVSYSVKAEAIPSNGTLTYKWRRNGANVADAGVYSGSTTNTLNISDNTDLTGNTYSVSVWVNGDARANSSNVVLTEL